MPWNTIKNEHDRWLPAVIACLILIGGALWAGSFLPTESSPPPTDVAKNESPAFTVQTFREWHGQVARFEGDSELPAEIYDVAVASLPDEIRAQLTAGIVANSEDELLLWIENLTS